MKDRARQGLEVGVGLALIGIQRWMSVRPAVEAELDRLGHSAAAEVSRQLGNTVSKAVTKLAAGATSTGS